MTGDAVTLSKQMEDNPLSVRPILQTSPQDYKTTALATKCADVGKGFELDSLKRIVETLLETLYSTPSGVGLAAPQIGVLLRIAVIDTAYRNKGQADPIVLINPTAESTDKVTMTTNEGCLSLPNLVGSVKRNCSVKVSSLNMRLGQATLTAKGFIAVVMQHEIDHLNGLLYLDRMARNESVSDVDSFPRRRAIQSLDDLISK